MPELPDITVYVERLEALVVGRTVEQVAIPGPSLLRTVDPPVFDAEGRRVLGVRRLAKRIVLELEDELFLVLHLMIAGRLQWRRPGASVRGRGVQAALRFADGTLVITEAGTRKRATLHVVQGRAGLAEHDRGGIEPLEADRDAFAAALRIENRTLKRALTDPRRFSGIGNAYSDEILHAARLSPITLTSRLTEDEIDRLADATRAVLTEWVERLRAEAGDALPAKVTAFRPEMKVHGRFGQACPDCGTPVARIVRAENEINYCPGCQTGGRVLRDRSLSRLLGDDWPG